MELAVERIAALSFILTGLSHLAAPAAWASLFAAWRAEGATGGLKNGLLNAPLALLIVGGHQLYTWPALLITITGWLLLAKTAANLLAPGPLLRAQSRVDSGAPWRYRVAGLFALAVGLLFGAISEGLLR
ncbi:MAG TPA: hypothetical protein VEC11_16385 [Allosphingosinicella sp.]|nr:hypothetical protein [Allosphingosinicella sp.]